MGLVEDLQRQLAQAWAIQSLLMDLFDARMAAPPRVNPDDFLPRLGKVLGGAETLMVVGSKTVATSGRQEDADPAIEVQRAYLIENSLEKDYVELTSRDAGIAGFGEAFTAGKMVEVFPVWSDGKLRGYVAFGAEDSVIAQSQTSVRVIKTVVNGMFAAE